MMAALIDTHKLKMPVGSGVLDWECGVGKVRNHKYNMEINPLHVSENMAWVESC